MNSKGQLLDIDSLQEKLRRFAAERDWDQFHSPKNLSAAIVVEASELLENFQWLSDENAVVAHKDPKLRERVSNELADVMIYCCRLADKMHIDLPLAIANKLEQNKEKYPIEQSKGNATKYSDF